MNDDELRMKLRAGARSAHAARTGTALDNALGGSFEDRVTSQILAEHRAGARVADAVALAAESTTHGAKVVPFRAARLTRWVAGLAAAAALALAVTHFRTGGEIADLPAYALVVTGGQDTTRSATHAPAASPVPEVRAVADAPLTVLLRPPTEVSGPVVARAFAVRGGHASDAAVAVRISESGSIEVQGAARDLAGAAPGEATLVIVIARDGVRADARAIAEGATAPHGVSVARVGIQIAP